MKTYYEILGVAASATADEIKRTFRREISKYHPDKVQHLGHEFQEMAATIAADLTEAYRVLMDPALRAKYDEELQQGTPHSPAPRRQDPAVPRRRADPVADPAVDEPHENARPTGTRGVATSAGIQAVRKATLAKLRTAIEQVLGAETDSVHGFDTAFLARSRKVLFKKPEPAIRILVKLVPFVDAAAITRIWPDAVAASAPDVITGVMLLGFGFSSSKDLSLAISEQRHLTGNKGPVLIPVDVRDWEALVPAETPAPLRTVLDRLRTNQV